MLDPLNILASKDISSISYYHRVKDPHDTKIISNHNRATRVVIINDPYATGLDVETHDDSA